MPNDNYYLYDYERNEKTGRSEPIKTKGCTWLDFSAGSEIPPYKKTVSFGTGWRRTVEEKYSFWTNDRKKIVASNNEPCSVGKLRRVAKYRSLTGWRIETKCVCGYGQSQALTKRSPWNSCRIRGPFAPCCNNRPKCVLRGSGRAVTSVTNLPAVSNYNSAKMPRHYGKSKKIAKAGMIGITRADLVESKAVVSKHWNRTVTTFEITKTPNNIPSMPVTLTAEHRIYPSTLNRIFNRWDSIKRYQDDIPKSYWDTPPILTLLGTNHKIDEEYGMRAFKIWHDWYNSDLGRAIPGPIGDTEWVGSVYTGPTYTQYSISKPGMHFSISTGGLAILSYSDSFSIDYNNDVTIFNNDIKTFSGGAEIILDE